MEVDWRGQRLPLFSVVMVSLYASYFAIAGLDSSDSFYWLGRSNVQGVDWLYPLSQAVYDGLNGLGLEHYRVYFGIALAIWVFQYLVCAKRDQFLATGLFVVSMYWFKGILNPGCLSVVVVCLLVHHLYTSASPRRDVALVLVLLAGLFKVTSLALLVPALLYFEAGRPRRFAALGMVLLAVGLLAYFSLGSIRSHLTLQVLKEQYAVQLAVLFAAMAGTTLLWYGVGKRGVVAFLVGATSCLVAVPFLGHRLLFAWVFGLILGALFCLAREKSFQWEAWLQSGCLVLILCLSFFGSNTGLYKASMVLPLLVFLPGSKVHRKRLGVGLCCAGLLLWGAKPIYNHNGGYELGALQVKSVLGMGGGDQYRWLTVEGEGSFLVVSWFADVVSAADSIVAEHSADSVSFHGRHSAFFNRRYDKPYDLKYNGTTDQEFSVPVFFGNKVCDERRCDCVEIRRGFWIQERRRRAD